MLYYRVTVYINHYIYLAITVAAQSKAWNVFCLPNTEIVGSNPTRGMDVCLHLSCVSSSLAMSWSPIRGVYRLCTRLKKLKWNDVLHMAYAPEGATGITVHYNCIYLMLALCGQNMLLTKWWFNWRSVKLHYRLCMHVCVSEVTTIITVVYVLFGGMWCLDKKKRRNAGQNSCQCYVLHKHSGGSEETLCGDCRR
jgi:hypothetical protein